MLVNAGSHGNTRAYGISEAKENCNTLGSATEKYLIILATFEADLKTSKILEEVNRYIN